MAGEGTTQGAVSGTGNAPAEGRLGQERISDPVTVSKKLHTSNKAINKKQSFGSPKVSAGKRK
jgi:hypothetical protein